MFHHNKSGGGDPLFTLIFFPLWIILGVQVTPSFLLGIHTVHLLHTI